MNLKKIIFISNIIFILSLVFPYYVFPFQSMKGILFAYLVALLEFIILYEHVKKIVKEGKRNKIKIYNLIRYLLMFVSLIIGTKKFGTYILIYFLTYFYMIRFILIIENLNLGGKKSGGENKNFNS